MDEREVMLRADLERAKDAVKAANACLPNEAGHRYAVARVRLDAELPLGIVQVDASSLHPGTVLPPEPERQDPPCVPPEELGAFPPRTTAMLDRLRDARAQAREGVAVVEGPVSMGGRVLTDADFVALADEAERGYDVSGLPLGVVGDEVGEHRFPADPRAPSLCIDCGCTLEAAQTKRRCGA